MIDIKFIGTENVTLSAIGSPDPVEVQTIMGEPGSPSIEFVINSNTFSKNAKNYYQFVIEGEDQVTLSGQIGAVTEPYQYLNLFLGCKQITDASNLELQGDTAKRFCYSNMFKDCVNLITPPSILPATTLADWCYQGMFAGCVSMTVPPALPATTLAKNCYYAMFYGCKALSTAPDLPASGANNWSYNSMFFGCDNLNQISCNLYSWNGNATSSWVYNVADYGTFYKMSELSNLYGYHYIPYNWDVVQNKPLVFISNGNTTVTLTKIGSPYDNEFTYTLNGGTISTYVPNTTIELQDGDVLTFRGKSNQLNKNTNANMYKFETTGTGTLTLSGQLANLTNGDGGGENKYRRLFYDCDNIVDASNLIMPTLNLDRWNFLSMFANCSNLTAAPYLPATTLAEGCYGWMFSGCTSLKDAPQLPATELVVKCYQEMFHGCSSLSSMKVEFTKWPSSSLSATQNWLAGVSNTGTFYKSNDLPVSTGTSYIPTGWVTAEYELSVPLTFKSTGDTTVKINKSNLSYNKNLTGWSTYAANTAIPLSDGEFVSFSGTNNIIATTFSTTGNGTLDLSGNCNSLINFETNLTSGCFSGLFSNCSTITNASDLVLPATDVNSGCYRAMFSGCSSLKTAPQIKAKKFRYYSCSNMFDSCISLISSPNLAISAVGAGCFGGMFQGCSRLKTPPSSIPVVNLSSCYSMFERCRALTSAPSLPSKNLANYCYYGMFYGCHQLTAAPQLPATTLAPDCYGWMFANCTTLKSITVNFTQWNNSNYSTSNWTNGVTLVDNYGNPYGTFYKPATLPVVSGNWAIPSFWNVVNK